MFSFQDVNIYFPERLARICNDMGVKNFLHVSALQQNLKHRSEWATTKVREDSLTDIRNDVLLMNRLRVRLACVRPSPRLVFFALLICSVRMIVWLAGRG